jgi:hypothetical protein
MKLSGKRGTRDYLRDLVLLKGRGGRQDETLRRDGVILTFEFPTHLQRARLSEATGHWFPSST